MKQIFDTTIVGGGPAGVAAAIYAARKKLRTLFIANQIGGQSIVSANIENWIGIPMITGYELSQKLEKHLRAQNSIEIKVPERVDRVVQVKNIYKIKTDKSEYLTKTIIVCSGGRDRALGVPGEEKFAGKGVAYCSTCDAPFFKDKKVVVVGGGNAGLEAALDLNSYAKSILLLERNSDVPGDPATLEQVEKTLKVEVILNAEVEEILGDQTVSGVRYKDISSGTSKTIEVQGVFAEIGVVPNSEFIKDLVATNDRGEIVVGKYTCGTSKPGIFAAGDVTDEPYKQNNIAVGDAIKAALSANQYLLNQRKQID